MDKEIQDFIEKKFFELRIDLTTYIAAQIKAEVITANKMFSQNEISKRADVAVNNSINANARNLKIQNKEIERQYINLTKEIRKEIKRTNKIIHTLRLNFSLIRSLANIINRFYGRSPKDYDCSKYESNCRKHGY
jgi:hypothetical protein